MSYSGQIFILDFAKFTLGMFLGERRIITPSEDKRRLERARVVGGQVVSASTTLAWVLKRRFKGA
jgi:hypothetical protein